MNEERKFKVSAVAVGTRDLPTGFGDLLTGLGEYVETAVEYNNDYLVGPALSKDTKLIVRLHDSSDPEYLLRNHLRYLGRPKADILLLDRAGLPPDLDRFEGLAETVGMFGTGLTVESLKDWKERYGTPVPWISLPVNPKEYRKSVIDAARADGTKIIGYEILGGQGGAPELLGTYGIQFLARYAGSIADIVVISSKANLENEMVLARTLEDLVNGGGESDPTVYVPDREILPVGPGNTWTRRVYTYSEVSISGKNHVFRNDRGDYLTDGELLISTSPSLEHIPVLDLENLTEADNILGTTLDIMYGIRGAAGTAWVEEVPAYYRYLVMARLSEIYSGRRWSWRLSRTGPGFRISVKDRWRPWKRRTEYILVVSERIGGDGWNVFFRNL